MADSNLDTSIAALKTELLNAIPTATVDELVSIARSAKGMNLGEDSSLEQAINTRVNTLASTATSDEVSKLATVIKQFLNPAAITVTNFTSVTGDLIPDTNEAYDLGSTTNRFKDLYISGNTLFLGDTKIQDDGTELKFLDSSDNPRVMKAKEIDLDDGTGERVRMRRNAQGRLAFRNIDNSGNDTGAVSTASTGATVGAYSLMSELPLSGVDAGTQAFVSENNKLFIWTGTGWYNIALVNQSPTPITGVDSTYALARDGTPTVITAVSTDPDGIPLQWSYQVTSGALGSTATVAQAGNVFTITPSTTEADAGNFTLTFSASDGINQSVANSQFSLQFVENHFFADVRNNGVATNNPLAVALDDTGENLYVKGYSGDAYIYKWELGTAYELGTIPNTYTQRYADSTVSTTTGLYVKPDGTKIIHYDGVKVTAIDLATPNDLSTASVNTYQYTAQGNEIRGGHPHNLTSITMSHDGTKFYSSRVNGFASTFKIHEHNLTTAWDFSTLQDSHYSFDMVPGGSHFGLYWSNDGLKFWNSNRETIKEYTTSVAFSSANFGAPTTYTYSDLIGGNPVNQVSEGGKTFSSYSFLNIWLSSDGKKMFIMVENAGGGPGVLKLTLTTANTLADGFLF